MEPWRDVWRRGFVPVLSTAAIEALAEGLRDHDMNLLQGGLTRGGRGILVGVVDAACALGYCGWKGEGLELVEDVERYFEEICAAVDERLGNSYAYRWFLNWFDDTPWAIVRRELLEECEIALGERAFNPTLTA